jgi:recombinational DNA repair protein (RecF pathway)
MSIEKYSTEAIIVYVIDSGENDAIVKMYTRDFGMIYAKSASLRKSVKLRAHIMQNRISSVTLVKGKEYYRLAGAKEEYTNSKNLPVITKIINKYIAGEQKNIKLYSRLIDYVNYKDIDEGMLKLTITSEVMIMLGYLNSESLGLKLEEYLALNVNDYVMHIQIRKKEAVQIVRTAMEASML